MIIERKIVQNGGSLSINLPPDLLQYLDLKEGDEVCIRDEIGKKGKYITIWKKIEVKK